MEYKKCGSCGCFKSIEDIGCRKSGIVYKCCKKCRNKETKKPDIEINADTTDEINEIKEETPECSKKMNKCIICKQLWIRREKVWESIECLKCYKCRANGGNPDDIDIAHEIYPECSINKNRPVFTPDSSSSEEND